MALSPEVAANGVKLVNAEAWSPENTAALSTTGELVNTVALSPDFFNSMCLSPTIAELVNTEAPSPENTVDGNELDYT